MSVRYIFALIAGILILAIGCSSRDSSPIAPDLSGANASAVQTSANAALWGLWDVQLDPSTNSAEIVPVRGAEFTANVTQFLQKPIAARNLMGIEIDPSTEWDIGYVKVDVIFTHPFPGLDVYTGFDVRGVCMGNGSISGIADGDIFYAGDDELRVLNADGLTRWFNPPEFTKYGTILGFTLGKLGTPSTDFSATLNGYKYFCDGLGPEDDMAEFFSEPGCPNSRGYFAAGNTLRRTYELQFAMPGGVPSYQFQYAVVASWEEPLNIPPVIPDDFELTANCQEAYCISTADQSDMFYSGPGNAGGTLALQVRIFDHQGVQNSSGVAGEIYAINLETPNGLIPTGGLATFDAAALSGALIGQDGISATYLLEVDDVNPPAAGVFNVLVSVENTDPASYDSGFPGFAFPDGVLGMYYTARVAVGSDVPPMVISIDPTEGYLGNTISDAEITGTNFIDGAEVTLIKNDDPLVVIEASNEAVTGGTSIVCDLELSASQGAEVGVYDVRVTNPGGLYGELADGFEVLEATWPYWWENHMYHPTHGGYNPMATSPDPASWQQKWSVPAPQTYKNITPLVAGDKIFYLSYPSYYDNLNARVYCHDLNTGAQLWNARVNYTLTTPRINAGFAYYKDGDDEYIVAAVDQIYCFDANSSGTNPPALWTFDDTSPVDACWIGSQMIIDDGKVLAKCQNQASLHILDVVSGTLLHEAAITGGGEAGVGAVDGKAYAVCGANLVCVDIDAGVMEWSTSLGYLSNLWVSPCLADGRAYVSTQGGHIVCVATETQGTHSPGDIVWDFNLPTSDFSAGGCSKFGDDLFVAIVYNGAYVYAVTDNGENASLKWQWRPNTSCYWDATTSVITTPTYANGLVVIPDRSTGIVYFLNTSNGTVVHQIATGETLIRTGASFVGDYMVVVGGTNLRTYYVP